MDFLLTANFWKCAGFFSSDFISAFILGWSGDFSADVWIKSRYTKSIWRMPWNWFGPIWRFNFQWKACDGNCGINLTESWKLSSFMEESHQARTRSFWYEPNLQGEKKKWPPPLWISPLLDYFPSTSKCLTVTAYSHLIQNNFLLTYSVKNLKNPMGKQSKRG